MKLILRAMASSCFVLVFGWFSCFQIVQAQTSSAVIQNIWETEVSDEDDREDYELAYFGHLGLFWINDDTKEIFHYSDDKVTKITDFEGYIIDQVKQGAVTVSVISTTEVWNDFEIQTEANGKKFTIDEMNDAPSDLKISYPYVQWTYKDWHSISKEIRYNLETREFESNDRRKYYQGHYDSLFKFHDEFQAKEIRPFEYISHDGRRDDDDVPFSENRYIFTTPNFALWKEAGGVYLDEIDDKIGTYRRIASDPGIENSFAVGERYATWSLVNGLGIYSFEKKKSYLSVSKLLGKEQEDLMIHDNLVAVLENKDDKKFMIKLVYVEELLKGDKSFTTHEEKSQTITPQYLSNIAVTFSDPSYNFLASPNYLFYRKGNEYIFHSRKENLSEANIYFWNTYQDPVFIDDKLYMTFEDMSFPDEPEDEEGDGIYRIDLESSDSEMIYKIKDELLSKLYSFGDKLYWYNEDDESINELNPLTKEIKQIDLDSNDVELWSVYKDQIVWIDVKKRNYILKYKNGDNPTQVITQWSEESGYPYQVECDGDTLYWLRKENGHSKLYSYNLTTNQEEVLVESSNGKEKLYSFTLKDDYIYFLRFSKEGSFGGDLVQLNRATQKMKILSSNVFKYLIFDDRVVSLKHGKRDFYVFDQPLNKMKDVSLRYTWKQLQSNNYKLWYDLRYSFHSDDIVFTVGNKKYTWTKLVSDKKLWEKVMKQKDKLYVTVRF